MPFRANPRTVLTFDQGTGMTALALTRVRSLGPVADAVRSRGGSIAKVFARADLPARLLESPDQLMPLRDQVALMEHAVRETGDVTLPLAISMRAGVAWLGAYGDRLRGAASLRQAIDAANALIAGCLQGGTEMRLRLCGTQACWTYRVTERLPLGRQANELLAFGYMVDVVRAFVGPGWHADHAVLPEAVVGRGAIEQTLGSPIAGGEVASLMLRADQLELPNPGYRGAAQPEALPAPDDFVGTVAALARVALMLEQRARLAWIARRLGMSTRSLQRRLSAAGTDVRDLQAVAARQVACERLARGARVIDVAGALGYADAAHFTRAFRAWTGCTPQSYRRENALRSSPAAAA